MTHDLKHEHSQIIFISKDFSHVDLKQFHHFPICLHFISWFSSGKWTGVISTARITHATPAAAYASVPEREWESDADLPDDAAGSCKDIAAQLIDTDHG